jgi:16S rRNA (cytosine1402-N4)-methyltransferase
MHKAVLLEETVQAFDGQHIEVFFDGTIGAGGHARAILEAHPEIKIYFACDADASAHELAKETLAPWEKKVKWIHGRFGDLKEHLKKHRRKLIDGFLIDIGVSSMQLDRRERGFSFLGSAPLDMRMDVRSGVTAGQIINEASEAELARIFFEYGEERRSRAAAKAIVLARKKRPIETTDALVDVIKPHLKWGKMHCATQIFQALRIAVNDELGQLKQGIASAIDALRPGKRMAVISFHSLEDRIVKWALREDERIEVITKKPIVAKQAEIKANPRSRSAKLRIGERQ